MGLFQKINQQAREENLEFLIAPDFISRTPRMDPQAMLRRIEENLPWRNKQSGARERRSAQKIPVEFVL